MRTKYCLIIGFVILLISPSIRAQEEACSTTREKIALLYREYHTKIEIEQPAGDFTNLKVFSKSGDVNILPSNNDNIIVEADVVITSMSEKYQQRFMKRFMTLGFEKENDKLVFRSNFANQKTEGLYGIGYIIRHIGTPGSKINFTMYVPHNLYVSVIDGSGDLNIKNLSNGIKIADGSGSIHVESISGHVEIYDNAGDIKIENIMNVGELIIRDESGDIYGNTIYGSVDIHDGSGSINLQNVNGLVDIHDGSGDINANVTDGRVNVHSDGSGSKNISYNTGY